MPGGGILARWRSLSFRGRRGRSSGSSRTGRPPTTCRRSSGLPIDPSDPDVGALIDAYEAFLAVAPPHDPAIAAAHSALLETASLLRWAAPAGPAEREYVLRHTEAISELAEGFQVDPLSYLRQAFEDDRALPDGAAR